MFRFLTFVSRIVTDQYVFLIITIAFLLIYFKNYWRAVLLAFNLPGPPALPFFGNVLLAVDTKKLLFISNHVFELFGPIGRVWISVIPFFIIVEPAHLQLILGNNKSSQKNVLYKFIHNFVGEGLITNNGWKWKKNRKLIQQYFNVTILKNYFKCFTEKSEMLVKRLENVNDINIIPMINKTILEILHDAILGITLEDIETSPFRKGELLVTKRIIKPWLMLNAIFKNTKEAKAELIHKTVLQNFVREILEKFVSEQNEGKPKLTNKISLLEMMVEISKERPEFTTEDIINEACTFMLAGQDSIGAAVVFSLYYIAKHQDIQEKIMIELNGIFDNNFDSRSASFEDLMEMKYLEQCVKETLRLVPSVPIIARKLLEDLNLGKIVIPEGSNIFISPFATHRLPHIFPDPLVYNPDRFSAENAIKMHPFAYIPFSAGPRNCIGYKFALLEIKTILSDILKHYHISLVPGHEELNLSYRVTVKAKGGIWIRFKQRNPE